MLLMHLFICFARVYLCPYSLPLGVEGWLRFVIVAYPGPFYKLFAMIIVLYVNNVYVLRKVRIGTILELSCAKWEFSLCRAKYFLLVMYMFCAK